MGKLAEGYRVAGRFDKSIPLLEDALKLQEHRLGRQHPATLSILANLGANYKDADRRAEALPLLEEAYRASKRYASLGWVGLELIDGYAKSGKTQKAATLAAELVTEARGRLPKDALQRAELFDLLDQCGLALLQLKAYTDAEEHLRVCRAIYEKAQPDDWATFNTQAMLGIALLGQKKYTEAEPLLLKGYEGMKQREKSIPPQGRDRLPEAADQLIELYTAMGKPDEVKKWRAERVKYGREVAPMPREAK